MRKMIKLSNVNKKFKDKSVLNNLSFNVESGKIMALLGANGAGKSSIIRLISTIYRPDTGEIHVGGLDTLKYPDEVRRKIGVLLGGDVSLYNSLTARENILYFANLQGMNRKAANLELEFLAKNLRMETYLDERVEKFSRGMKQKVAITRALIHSPEILLLDEPSTGLDINSIATVRSLIHTYKKMGRTILLSTHNISEMELCDAYIFLKNGKIKSTGSIGEIQKEDELRSLFLH